MCVYHCPSSWLHLSVRSQLVCQGNKQSIMNFVSLSTLSPKVSRVSDDTTSISSIDIGDQAAVQCSSVEDTRSPTSTNTAAETTPTELCDGSVFRTQPNT